MISIDDLRELAPVPVTTMATAAIVTAGIPIPKPVRVTIFSADEWEGFVEEWGSTLKPRAKAVRRSGGAGDMGVDVAAFLSDSGFRGPWENYQCKRYDHPLHPSDIWVELGKVVFYSFQGEYSAPVKYYFAGSQGVGASVGRLLGDAAALRDGLKGNWDKHCRGGGISSAHEIPLEGPLLEHLNRFDFAIFDAKTVVELIDDHSRTHFHAARFGGGLPARAIPGGPPDAEADNESRYIRALLDAYGDRDNVTYGASSDLNKGTAKDYLRQRERFYHAESLRNFARDTVPEGTFTALQNEIFHAVVDTCEGPHDNGFERMRQTLDSATRVPLQSNALSSAVMVQDRQGICHQLTNDGRLNWKPEND